MKKKEEKKKINTELHNMIDDLFGEKPELSEKEKKAKSKEAVSKLRKEFDKSLECDKILITITAFNKTEDEDEYEEIVSLEYGKGISSAEVIGTLETIKYSSIRKRC